MTPTLVLIMRVPLLMLLWMLLLLMLNMAARDAASLVFLML